MADFPDLRAFLAEVERRGELRRIREPVDPKLEVTEISRRVLAAGGPALCFENPTSGSMPMLTNLFGTVERVALALGGEDGDARARLRAVGELLAFLKQPEPPSGFKAFREQFPAWRQVLNMAPRQLRHPPARARQYEGDEVDLGLLPVQTCWPEDAGPLLTWGLTVTRGPRQQRLNVGIYRQQVIGRNRLIMRWLAHRGGALDYRDHCAARSGEPFPVAVAIGADPATILAAVTPVPDSLGEYQFAGLLAGRRPELTPALGSDLMLPASAEIILEGVIHPGDTAEEGPFGDHTGYYNEVDRFPVFTVERLSMRQDAIYHSTYTGRPPDEPAVLGEALNEVFVPILQKQFPEITDFFLPPEGCSYRLAVVSIRKAYAGHARRVMFGIWSFLRQFMYTKFVVVVDEDINVRNWPDVIWAITTRMDPVRDTVLVDHTPIDYLDFASPVSGLGGKMGLDATHKWPGETQREWGRAMDMDPEVSRRVDAMWSRLGLAM